MIGKILHLAVLGFLTVLLAGPILGIAGALLGVVIAVISIPLPFVVIGLLIWLPIRYCMEGKDAAMRGARNAVRKSVVQPLSHCRRRVRPMFQRARTGCTRVGHSSGLVRGIAVEAFCGAVLGCATGAGMHHLSNLPPHYIGIGVAAGALLGVFVAVARHRGNQETITLPPTEAQYQSL